MHSTSTVAARIRCIGFFVRSSDFAFANPISPDSADGEITPNRIAIPTSDLIIETFSILFIELFNEGRKLTVEFGVFSSITWMSQAIAESVSDDSATTVAFRTDSANELVQLQESSPAEILVTTDLRACVIGHFDRKKVIWLCTESNNIRKLSFEANCGIKYIVGPRDPISCVADAVFHASRGTKFATSSTFRMVKHAKKVCDFSALTTDEKEVLRAVAEGWTLAAIAETIGMPERTVDRLMATLKEYFKCTKKNELEEIACELIGR